MQVRHKSLGFGTLIAYHETPKGVSRFDQPVQGAIEELEQLNLKNGWGPTLTSYQINGGNPKKKQDRILFISDFGTLEQQEEMARKLREAGVKEVVVGEGKEFCRKMQKVVRRYLSKTWTNIVEPYLPKVPRK